MKGLFHLRIARQTSGDKFYTRVYKVFLPQNPNPDFVDIFEKVLTSQADDLVPGSPDKSYNVYLMRNTLEEAKKDGIALVRAYRRDIEGIAA